MKRLLIVLITCAFAAGTLAEDRTSSLHFPNTDVRDVLDFYARALKKPIYVSTQISGTVTLEWFGLTKEVPEVIRKTLLEKYGIAIRETKDGEVLVEYSKDPKYPRRSDPPPTKAEQKVGPPRIRVRPITPEGTVVVPRPAPGATLAPK